MKLNQRGKFIVTNVLLQDTSCHESVKLIMSKMIIIRCEYMYDTETFEYIAISELFDEVKAFSETPMYNIIINSDNEIGAVRL